MEAKETGENQVFREAERFVVGGLRLIKKENFLDASKYLRNPQKASQFGLYLSDDPRTFVATKPIDFQTEVDIITFCATNSWFNEPVNGRPEIVLAEAFPHPNRHGISFSKNLYHELSLMCAEEWVHALQYLKGGSLTGYENNEFDVAVYLIQQGIPITDSFLSRYNRKKELFPSK